MAHIGISCSETVKKMAEELAWKNRKKVSEYIRDLIKQDWNETGEAGK